MAATDGTPSHWHQTFAVADRDAAAATAEHLGATVLAPRLSGRGRRA
jgi:predicted enzyme related to lactoylglutathione lyase